MSRPTDKALAREGSDRRSPSRDGKRVVEPALFKRPIAHWKCRRASEQVKVCDVSRRLLAHFPPFLNFTPSSTKITPARSSV
jgi:hypothetical protein